MHVGKANHGLGTKNEYEGKEEHHELGTDIRQSLLLDLGCNVTRSLPLPEPFLPDLDEPYPQTMSQNKLFFLRLPCVRYFVTTVRKEPKVIYKVGSNAQKSCNDKAK